MYFCCSFSAVNSNVLVSLPVLPKSCFKWSNVPTSTPLPWQPSRPRMAHLGQKARLVNQMTQQDVSSRPWPPPWQLSDIVRSLLSSPPPYYTFQTHRKRADPHFLMILFVAWFDGTHSSILEAHSTSKHTESLKTSFPKFLRVHQNIMLQWPLITAHTTNVTVLIVLKFQTGAKFMARVESLR